MFIYRYIQSKQRRNVCETTEEGEEEVVRYKGNKTFLVKEEFTIILIRIKILKRN